MYLAYEILSFKTRGKEKDWVKKMVQYAKRYNSTGMCTVSTSKQLQYQLFEEAQWLHVHG